MMLTLLLSFSGLVYVNEAVVRNQYFDRKVEYSDLVDQTSIIKTSVTYNVVECSKSCGQTAGCVAFYFTPSTKQCQEHSLLSNKDTSDFTVSQPGSIYYQISPDVPSSFVCPVSNGSWITNQLPDGSFAQYLIDNTITASWSSSDAYCRARGAHLIRLTTPEKMKFYLDNFIPCPDVSASFAFWIDGHNYPPNMDFITHDGEIIPRIPELWYPGKPNNEATSNCVQSDNGFLYKLDDNSCSNTKNILCEKMILA